MDNEENKFDQTGNDEPDSPDKVAETETEAEIIEDDGENTDVSVEAEPEGEVLGENETVSNVSTMSEASIPAKKPKRSIKELLKDKKIQAILAVVVLLLVGGIYFLLTNKAEPTEVVEPEETVTAETLEINSAEDLETARQLLDGIVEEDAQEIEELTNFDEDEVIKQEPTE